MTLLGRGMYSYSRAASLIGSNPQSVRRWLVGYKSGGIHRSGVIPLDLPVVGDETTVSFLNLVELNLIGKLRRQGISLGRIREAAELIVEETGVEHPFASSAIRYDTRDIFLRLGDECMQASGRERGHYVMEKVLEEYLDTLEFSANDGLAERWYPEAGEKLIVVDPHYLFGEPVLLGTRLSTRTLMQHHLAGDSAEVIADWYDVSRELVSLALAFEQSLAA